MQRWLAPAISYLCAAVLCIALGIVATVQGWPPAPQVVNSIYTFHDLRANWRNDFAIEPTRLLVEARGPNDPAFRAVDPAAQAPGNVLIAGLMPDEPHWHGAVLHAPDGTELHRWPIDYALFDPKKPFTNVLQHGLAALPDGSLIVAFDQGTALARVDACGTPLWVTRGGFSHSVEIDEAGRAWAWLGLDIAAVDVETGAVERRIGFVDDVVERHGLQGAMAIRTWEDAATIVYQGDPFHPNDVEPLPAALAPAFPQFEAGDLLISLRELNLVAVLDAETGAALWWQHGPWLRQHDPDWQPDGTISVYDNLMGKPGSRILSIDPRTRAVRTLLEEGPDLPFDSWRRGKHEVLANGNLLVVESEAGRVFEATADGRLVWEWHNRFDAARNGVVTTAIKLPEDYFDPGALDCGDGAAVAASPAP